MTRFPKKEKGQSLSADHINALGDSVTNLTGTSHSNITVKTGHLRQMSILPHHVEAFFKIDSHDEVDMPDADPLLFRGTFFSYSQKRKEWVEDTVKYFVNLRGVLRNTNNPKNYPLLLENDIINVRYDENKGALVPTSYPVIREARVVSDIEPDTMGDVMLTFRGPNGSSDDSGRLVTLKNTEEELLKENEIITIYHNLQYELWLPLLYVEPEEELPAWEIEATLPDVLLVTDLIAEAIYTKIRSVYPHIKFPPGVNPDTLKVEFHNTWKLDAVCNSKVILQRVFTTPCEKQTCTVRYTTGAPGFWSYTGDPCPDGCQCPPLPTDHPAQAETRVLNCLPDDGVRWELRKVEKFKARHIKFRYEPDSSDYSLIDFWEGEDPTSCSETLTIEFPLGEPCVACDMLAFYDPKSDTYQANTSPSAVLGEAETVDIMQSAAFDGCSINYIKQSAKVFPCESTPSLITITPDLISLDVLTGSDLQVSQQSCNEACSWTWNAGTSTWDQVTSCSEGCTCGTAPTLPPGEWNNFAVSYESPCTRTAVTGLVFTKSVIQVCSFMTTGPEIIPVNNCPPGTGGGSGGA